MSALVGYSASLTAGWFATQIDLETNGHPAWGLRPHYRDGWSHKLFGDGRWLEEVRDGHLRGVHEENPYAYQRRPGPVGLFA